MLTDTKLKSLKGREKAYKVADRDGLYVVVSPKGTVTFRYDYRINGRRETLTIGRYGSDAMSLAEARDELMQARKLVHDGISPAQQKAEGKKATADSDTFETYAGIWLRDADLAESTAAMRKSILDRDVLPELGKRRMEEIKPSQIIALCDKIKERGAPATAVHVREIIQQVYRHAIGRGLKLENPAEAVKASSIATFKPRERALAPDEIRRFLVALDGLGGTMPMFKLALRAILLTMCRKGEIIHAKWNEVDFAGAVWTIPAARMKAGRAHRVYLSRQMLDLLVALKAWAGSSPYVLPGRYETDQPISDATLNRVITLTLKKLEKDGDPMPSFTVHDLRRTGSTLLHEAGFNSDWIEKCLAHEQKSVRAIYNKAQFAGQRRVMLQAWADMVDAWVRGESARSIISEARIAAMEAADGIDGDL